MSDTRIHVFLKIYVVFKWLNNKVMPKRLEMILIRILIKVIFNFFTRTWDTKFSRQCLNFNINKISDYIKLAIDNAY